MAASEEKPIKKEKKKRKKKKAQVGESDPFRGLLFSKMISDSLPHTWERTNLSSPHLGPSHQGITIEDIVCPRCMSYLPENPHETNCIHG
jgi:hypothetical protein